MSEEDLDKAEARRYLEGLIAALQVFREHATRVSVAQVQATLLTAIETMDLQQGERLPVVGDYARGLKLTPSGASRLMKNLCELADDDRTPLIDSDAGPMGSRSEAFILSDEGRKVIVRALKVLTGRKISRFETHDFLTFAFARYGKKDAGPLRVQVLGPRMLLVGPRSDTLSQEVRTWCDEQFSYVPEMSIEEDGVRLVFKEDNDAFFFRMRW